MPHLLARKSDVFGRISRRPTPRRDHRSEPTALPSRRHLRDSRSRSANGHSLVVSRFAPSTARFRPGLACALEEPVEKPFPLDKARLAEYDAEGFSQTTRLPGWTLVKIVTSAMAGLLSAASRTDVQTPAGLTEWPSEGVPRRAITWDQLLRMSSGLFFPRIDLQSLGATAVEVARAASAHHVD